MYRREFDAHMDSVVQTYAKLTETTDQNVARHQVMQAIRKNMGQILIDSGVTELPDGRKLTDTSPKDVNAYVRQHYVPPKPKKKKAANAPDEEEEEIDEESYSNQ